MAHQPDGSTQSENTGPGRQSNQPRQSDPLPLGVKLGYGVAGFGDSALYGVFAAFYLYFLTDVARVVPILAGTLIIVGIIWDAVTDPLVGMLSDRSTYRFGRRRPYMLVFAVPLGLSSWLIFSDFSLGPSWTYLYHLSMLLVYLTIYTLFYVPWTAFGAEIATDYDGRSSLMSYKMGWAALGAILGGAVPLLLVEQFRGLSGSEKIAWSGMAAVVGLIASATILISWSLTRGLDAPRQAAGVEMHWSDPFREMIGVLRSNRPFRYVVGLFTFGVMAEALSASYVVYFGQYYVQLSEREISFVMLIFFTAGFLWIPVLNLTAQRIGKRGAYALFLSIWVVAYVLTFLLVGPGSFVLLCVLRAFASAGWATVWALGWAMIGDVVEVDEFQTGLRREGLYYGVIQFIQKLAVGLVLLAGGGILSGVGYVPDVHQVSASLLGIRLTFCVGVSMLLVTAITIVLLNPMTKRKHDALRAAIASRKAGGQYTTTLFEDIL